MPREASPRFHFGLGLPPEQIESRDTPANGLIRAPEARKSHHLLANRINSFRRKIIPKDVRNVAASC